MKLLKARSKLLLLSALVANVSYFIMPEVLRWVPWLWVPWVWFIQPLLLLLCPLLSGGAAYTIGINKKYPRTRVAAMALMVAGAVSLALFDPFHPRLLLHTAIGETLAPLMMLGGAVLTLGRPKAGGILMLLGTIVVLRTPGAFPAGAFPPGSLFFLFPGIALALAPERKRPAAIYVAMGLAMFGGAFALLCAVVAPYMIPYVISPPRILQEELAYWIWVLLFPGMGLLGGILVLIKPKVAGILMLISGIISPAGFIAYRLLGEYVTIMIYALAFFPLLIAGTIACIKRPAAIYVAMGLAIFGGAFALLIAPPRIFQEMPLAYWIWVLLFPGMGLLGGILVLIKPKVAGILMLISGIIGSAGFIAFRLLGEYVPIMVGALACFPLLIAGTIACNKK